MIPDRPVGTGIAGIVMTEVVVMVVAAPAITAGTATRVMGTAGAHRVGTAGIVMIVIAAVTTAIAIAGTTGIATAVAIEIATAVMIGIATNGVATARVAEMIGIDAQALHTNSATVEAEVAGTTDLPATTAVPTPAVRVARTEVATGETVGTTIGVVRIVWTTTGRGNGATGTEIAIEEVGIIKGHRAPAAMTRETIRNGKTDRRRCRRACQRRGEGPSPYCTVPG